MYRIAVAGFHDFDFGRHEFGVLRREGRTRKRGEFAQLPETAVKFVERNPERSGQLRQMIPGDLLEVVVENLFKHRGQRVLAPELELQAFGKVTAADAGRIEPLHELERFFDDFDRLAGGHCDVRHGAAQIAGVVDAADDLGADPPQVRGCVRKRQLLQQLFLQRRRIGQRVEQIFAAFGVVVPGAVVGGQRQVVAPFVGLGRFCIEVRLVLGFGWGGGSGSGRSSALSASSSGLAAIACISRSSSSSSGRFNSSRLWS